ncbi:MAG: hypothetical protein HKO72_12170 [Flavobacteriaceae bacterium]|nr:hypothetical protein [Flavobacteriaceae bacterium]
MALSIIKETIELEGPLSTDASGNIYLTKRVNLKEGYRHNLLQVDCFEDSTLTIYSEPANPPVVEVAITPYPAIPTDMTLTAIPSRRNRYAAAGDDSIFYKELFYPNRNSVSSSSQFPSPEIASQNKSFFYSDHLYINICIHGETNTTYGDIAYSFMFVLDNKSTSTLEHSLGVLAESHNAMCALLMSNGRMTSVATLRGNVFPMWRYGGIRPETMITPLAANSFFFPLSNRDSEQMQDTLAVRNAVSDARQMNTFDGALGPRRPDWLREFLNGGLESGPIRPNPIPLRKADNGNTRMF